MSATTIPRALPSPGWYGDPWGAHALRWWDGAGWTGYTYDWSNRPPVGAPRPTESKGYTGSGWGRTPSAPPMRAGGLALLGLVAGTAFGVALGVVWLAFGGTANSPLAVLLTEIGLWTGFVGACAVASRNKGTGRLAADFDLRFAGWKDVGVGLLASVVGRLLIGIVTAVLVALGGQRLSGSNDTQLTQFHSTFGLLVVGLVLCLGAPVVEELYFRGLVQGTLTARYGAGWGIVLQAGLFGVAHFEPSLGIANITVIVGIATFGLVQGWMRNRFGRLGPGIVSHSMFNLVAFLLLLHSGLVPALP